MNVFSSMSLTLLLFLFTAAPCHAGNETITPDEQQLRHIKTVLWPQAYREQDTELLGRLLDDSFQMIDGDGNRSDKNSELDWVRKNAWNPGSFEYRIERLDIYDGSMAIVDGTGIAETYSYKSSNVLSKKAGQWRAVASHVSGYRERSEQD